MATDISQPDFVLQVTEETSSDASAQVKSSRSMKAEAKELDRRIARMMDAAAEMEGSWALALRSIEEMEHRRGELN